MTIIVATLRLDKVHIFSLWIYNYWNKKGVFWMYRGYYTVARRYEFYVWVAHEWVKRTSEILFLPLKQKIHIFELTCNVLLLYRHTDDGVFDDFLKFQTTFWRFLRIFQNCFEGQTNVSGHFLKISEDCRRLSRKTRRCFDHTPTNLRRLKIVFIFPN